MVLFDYCIVVFLNGQGVYVLTGTPVSTLKKDSMNV